MQPQQFEHLIIRPTLQFLSEFNSNLYSESAVTLLLGTAAQESRLGYYLHQIRGPAKGPYQIEPATHADIVDRYLQLPRNDLLRELVESLVSRDSKLGDDEQLVNNFRYSTAICRVRYWYEPDPLPSADDLEGIGQYWDTHYNANPDHGTVDEFVRNYNRLVRSKGVRL